MKYFTLLAILFLFGCDGIDDSEWMFESVQHICPIFLPSERPVFITACRESRRYSDELCNRMATGKWCGTMEVVVYREKINGVRRTVKIIPAMGAEL